MSRINLPVNQVRLTNVAVVRMNFHGKRFEVACYRNKILNYRQGIETDLSEVLQTDRVFTNVSKGLIAPSKDLKEAFQTTDQEQVCKMILDKGQIQISDMERSATIENTAREVANMVATKCVNPVSNRPYTTNQIRDAMKESEISVQPTTTRSVKQQFLDCVKVIREKGVLDIQRAKMELAIVVQDPTIMHHLVSRLKLEANAIICQPNASNTGNDSRRIQFLIDPSKYRAVDTLTQKSSGTLEIVRQIVRQEGDVDVSLELERNTARQNEQAETIQKKASMETMEEELMREVAELMQEVAALDKDLDAMNLDAAQPYNDAGGGNGYHENGNGNSSSHAGDIVDDDNHDDVAPHISMRKKNKKAQKKSKKAKRREKEEISLRQERIDAEKERRTEREFRLSQQCNPVKDEGNGKPTSDIISGSRKTCNTCGGSFTPSEYRAHFKSDWHRYNMKLKLKGLAPIDEHEFKMFDADAFFSDDF